MTDQQAADRATQIRVFTEGTSSGDVKPVSVDYMRSLASDFDALSARLAQECALRAQAEQERDEANRWRDSWHDEAKAAIATASQFERERNEAEARLREYEEALKETKEVLAAVVSHPRWLSIGAIDNHVEVRFSRRTYERARAALAASRASAGEA